MTESKTVLTRYCREVSNWLPCSGSRKKQILQSIRLQAEIFLEENPDADYAALTARFGTPEEIAASTLEEMGSENVLKSLRLRKRIAALLAAFVIVFAIVLGGFLVYILGDMIRPEKQTLAVGSDYSLTLDWAGEQL